MTRPKGVRVTVERYSDAAWDHICKVDLYSQEYSAIRKAGVPALKPGESVTGRMVFIADKKKGAK